MELKIPASTAASSLLLAGCIVCTLESRCALRTDPGCQPRGDAAGDRDAAALRWAGSQAGLALSWPNEVAYASGPDRAVGTADDRSVPPFGVTFDGDAGPCRPADTRHLCNRGTCALALAPSPNAFRGSAAPGHFWSGAAISR